MSDLKMKETPKKSWRKSIEANGITSSLEVKEIENGFILRYCKYGKNPAKEDDYFDVTKEYFSKTNPLDNSEKDDIESMKELLNFSVENLL